MNIDITLPDDRASIVSAIANMIQSSLDDKSVRQHAELILDEYIIRTNHHIWMVGQCAKILKEVVIKYYHDTEMFDTNIEFHDYDKLHNPNILPVYALACHYFYFHKKDVKYKVDEEWLEHEFEDVAWPKHHQNNKHHYAEYYGKKTGKESFDVPETYDVLSLVEMYADWMAMGIVNGGTAHEWWTANYGEDKKYDFHGRDLGVIQSCILVEDKSENQLAYLRQFKDVEPTWVPPTEIESFDEENPLDNKEVNESIENFFNYQANESLSLKRDELYIGPIDPMIIDPEKMMKLAEYPDLLLALKKWTTTPDHNLSPALIYLGKLVDEIYQFKNTITCYRGIRTGFSTRPKQNLMGAIDDEIEYLRLLKPGFDKPGQTFSFESPEPMSLARSPYIAKIYGNFIIKTEVPADANKLVITPELSYLLQQMEVEYPEYRAVNLSITHEVIVFPGTKLDFEIVSVHGDISAELETMKEHSFEGLGNTEMNGTYYSVDRISSESLSTKEYTEADINSIEDLKEFYKHCSYGLIDFKANKPWKETHKNTTFEDWEKHWRLLSVEQLLKYKCGVCYDTAKANDYFLTKLKVEHVNLFAMTKRDVESADYNDDPTHTFTVYKDSDNKWKWLEGSWGQHKNNTLSASSSDDIIKQVAQILANACGKTNYIGVVTKFPADGVNMETFYNALKKFVINPKMVAEPDKEYSKEAITPQVEKNISTEALSPDTKKKKQLIIDYICSVCDIMDPSKLNSKRYHRLLDSMSDKEFDQWMNYVKEGKWKIHIVAPNLVVTLKNENSLKAADKVKCKLFHRLWMTDDSTGRQYLTDNEYLVLNLPVRRQQQFLDEKMSVPDNDKQIDGLTGQVTGDSKSSAVTNPEIQILAARGLDATLEEFVNVRGGNIAAYSDFKRQAEETGEIKLNSLDQNTRSRVAVVGQVLLRSMMIENNIVE